MPTLWINQEKIENAPSITFDEVGATFDDARYNFNGQLFTNWINQIKT